MCCFSKKLESNTDRSIEGVLQESTPCFCNHRCRWIFDLSFFQSNVVRPQRYCLDPVDVSPMVKLGFELSPTLKSTSFFAMVLDIRKFKDVQAA